MWLPPAVLAVSVSTEKHQLYFPMLPCCLFSCALTQSRENKRPRTLKRDQGFCPATFCVLSSKPFFKRREAICPGTKSRTLTHTLYQHPPPLPSSSLPPFYFRVSHSLTRLLLLFSLQGVKLSTGVPPSRFNPSSGLLWSGWV